MSSNYEWQKHLSNERVQARLQEATEYRRLKQTKGESQFALSMRLRVSLLLKLLISALAGAIAVVWLLMATLPVRAQWARQSRPRLMTIRR
jgi:hypothetical protein